MVLVVIGISVLAVHVVMKYVIPNVVEIREVDRMLTEEEEQYIRQKCKGKTIKTKSNFHNYYWNSTEVIDVEFEEL